MARSITLQEFPRLSITLTRLPQNFLQTFYLGEAFGKNSKSSSLAVTLNKICIHVSSSARPATALVLLLSAFVLYDHLLTVYRAAAAGDVSSIIQNFMDSLKGGNMGSSQQSSDSYTTLPDLLWPSHTIPTVDKASPELIDALIAQLPTTPFLLEADVEDVDQIDPNSETARMAMQTLDREEKVDVLKRILRAPQLRGALISLTEALKTGALPTVAQGLKIDVENGGYLRGGAMPMGGGDAVKAFVEGVKKTVENEDDDEDDEDEMDMN